MPKPSLVRSIDFTVSPLYVYPLYPKRGESIEITIQTATTDEIVEVRLVSFQLGREKQILMQPSPKGSLTFHRCRLAVLDDPIQWYFFLVCKDRAYSYSKVGLKASVPPLAECFSLKPNLEPVQWVKTATCYQIFPDRFRNGNPNVGATDGAYQFDGGTVTVHDFTEEPLDYQSGRCLDFFNGDLDGILQSIDHFKRLGVTVLYLNPIGRSQTTHRYDCTDFFHVDEKLGGDEAFHRLCARLHENGIRIVVDISINHTGTGHPWYQTAITDPLSKEASYYYADAQGKVAYWQDVPTLPQLNYSNQELRNIMYRSADSVMRSFLKQPYLQDGWRLDVASEVGRRGSDQLCEEVWREVRDAVKTENPQAYLVGEDWVDSTPFLQGDMWDATMNYIGSSRLIRSWMGETDRYLCDGWGHLPKPTRPFTGIEMAEALKRHLLAVNGQMLPMQMNLINSHDTARLYNNTELFDWNLYKGVVRLLYILPGMPNIYYGEEIALAGPYGSVEQARYPMQWDQRQWNCSFLDLYTELGALRIEHADTLGNGSWAIIYADEQVCAFARYSRKEAIVCILNRRESMQELMLPNEMLQITSLVKTYGTVCTVNDDALKIILKGKESALLVGIR